MFKQGVSELWWQNSRQDSFVKIKQKVQENMLCFILKILVYFNEIFMVLNYETPCNWVF